MVLNESSHFPVSSSDGSLLLSTGICAISSATAPTTMTAPWRAVEVYAYGELPKKA